VDGRDRHDPAGCGLFADWHPRRRPAPARCAPTRAMRQ